MKLFRRRLAPSARMQRDEWVAWLKLSGVKPRTIEGYQRLTERFLERWPDTPFCEFTDEHITGFVEEASIRSRQQRRSAFQNWFGWAWRTHRIDKNVMAHVPTYRQPPQDPVECFTEQDVARLTSLPFPDGDLMAVLFGTGIRKGEARNLTVQRIDFQHGELTIIDGVKGTSLGVVPISARLVGRLGRFVECEELGPEQFLWYSHPGGSHTRRHDRPISDAAMHQWWGRCVEAAGVEYRKLHATRHTYATHLRREGLPIDDVSDLLRHRDPRTTRKVYIHTNVLDIKQRMTALGVEALV